MVNACCRSVPWFLKVSLTMEELLYIGLDCLVSKVTELHDFQCRDADKYGHGSRRTHNQE
jgi:hypothetical protein